MYTLDIIYYVSRGGKGPSPMCARGYTTLADLLGGRAKHRQKRVLLNPAHLRCEPESCDLNSFKVNVTTQRRYDRRKESLGLATVLQMDAGE